VLLQKDSKKYVQDVLSFGKIKLLPPQDLVDFFHKLEENEGGKGSVFDRLLSRYGYVGIVIRSSENNNYNIKLFGVGGGKILLCANRGELIDFFDIYDQFKNKSCDTIKLDYNYIEDVELSKGLSKKYSFLNSEDEKGNIVQCEIHIRRV